MRLKLHKEFWKLALLMMNLILSIALVAAGLVVLGGGLYIYAWSAPALQVFAPAILRGPAAGRRIALTFDDGPASVFTEQILDILHDRKVKATFFVCGKNVERYPNIVRRIRAEGHALGNHTYSHSFLYFRSRRFMADEIDRTQEALQKVTGECPSIFRPPYGARWLGLVSVLRKRGLRLVNWSDTGYDWKCGTDVDGLPTILQALDYVLGKLEHHTIQINAAVDLDNLEDLPALAKFCTERNLVLYLEAVHNVVRTTWKTEDVELKRQELDTVADYVMRLRKEYKCVGFYKDYYNFYRNDGFTQKFPCRSASHLVNMRPDGSIQFPCAFVSLHRGAPDMSLREIYASPEVRKIIAQSPQMWDFCKGCKIGCPYEVSAYRNSPLTAIRSALDFMQVT